MKDFEIDRLLNDIHNSELYIFQDLEDHLEGLKYRKSVTYLKDELRIIRQPFNNSEVLELTPLGNRIMTKGGWIEHQRIESEKEARADKKDNFDFKVSKFRYHTFWWVFIFGVIGAIFGVYNFINGLSPSKELLDQQNRIEKLELELQKLQPPIFQNQKADSSFTNKIEVDSIF